MKKGSICITLLICCLLSNSQTLITGKISNGNQPLPFASIRLINQDSVVINKVSADSNGIYTLRNTLPGTYLITASAVGYAPYTSLFIIVKESDIFLPVIIMTENKAQLGEIVVTARKPLYEQHIDRLTVNVQNSISSSGNTVLDIIQKSPGVTVNKQSNQITMNGKSGVQVMINNKIVSLPIDAVVQMLDGMSAANVEKIEFINTPPARYDAEGNAGIIHVITKNKSETGTNGSIGITLGYRWAETWGTNINLSHRSKNFAATMDYSILTNHNLHLSEITRQTSNNGYIPMISDFSHRENTTTQQNLNAGIEWKLNSKNMLNLSLTSFSRDWEMTAITYDSNNLKKDSSVFTHMDISETNIWKSISAGIGLNTRINSKSEFNFSLDYLYYHNTNPSGYLNKAHYEQNNIEINSNIDLQKTTPIRFFIAKADYQLSLTPTFTLEAGVKGVASTLHNNVIVQRFENNEWSIDSNFTSYSTLNELSGAVYIATKWTPAKKWSLNSGLRYEYIHTSITKPNSNDYASRNSGYLFPSIFLKKEISAGKDLQFAYSRRITRPTYNDIAPYVFFWSPNTFSAGNTALLPAISDAIKAGFHSNKWIISLQFSHTRNEINSYQPLVDSQSNNLIYRSENMNYLNTVSLTNSFSFNIASWWEIQTNVTLLYQTARAANTRDNTVLHMYGSNINLVNSLRLPRHFSVEISGLYQSKTYYGINMYLPAGSFNAGIQKVFRENGTLRLAMDDILHTNIWKMQTFAISGKLNSYFMYDYHNQYIRLTYNRKLGNNKMKSVKITTGAEEEKGRVTN